MATTHAPDPQRTREIRRALARPGGEADIKRKMGPDVERSPEWRLAQRQRQRLIQRGRAGRAEQARGLSR